MAAEPRRQSTTRRRKAKGTPHSPESRDHLQAAHEASPVICADCLKNVVCPACGHKEFGRPLLDDGVTLSCVCGHLWTAMGIEQTERISQ
jgi:hypothetical protein